MTPNHSLIAQLPKIGPVLGWTREQADVTVSRLWAKADDVYSGRAVLALTALWDGTTASAVRFWKVHSIRLPNTDPPAAERLALADIELPQGASPVRMVMLHIREKQGEEELPAVYDRARRFQALGAYELEALGSPQEFALPEAQAVDFGEFAPQLTDLERKSAEQYATDLFRELEHEREERRRRGAGPIPKSLSRRYRDVPSIAACEVRPSRRPAGSPLVIAAGSCRHPGVGFDRGRTDTALNGIAKHAKEGEGVDLALMLGDQIYVDAAAGVLDSEERLEKYARRYDAAFASPGFRAVSASVPTYMLADDHEVRDGWPNDSLPAPKEFWDRSVEWAWRLYLAHQRWHGPGRPPWARRPRLSRYSFWYEFEQRGYPFFAFDARFERRPGGAHIVGREQIAAFKTWLRHVARGENERRLERHVPKFVLSGSVITPGLQEFVGSPERRRRADNWQGFAADRERVARLVAQSSLQNIVFVSGDYHCAAIGHFDFSGARGYAVVAPPLYAPYPFANALPSDVALTDPVGDGAHRIGECVADPFPWHGFALIRARREGRSRSPDDWEIDVEFHDEHGGSTRRALLARGTTRWHA
jgi:cholesterol oxidase